LIAQPLRVALTGKTVSPGIDEVMVTLGKERVIKKIHKAIAYSLPGAALTLTAARAYLPWLPV